MSTLPGPHAIIFPFPAQGHVNSMVKLAELLCLAGGINITFLLSRNIHDRLLHHTDVLSRFRKYSGFHFVTLPNGVYEEDLSTGDRIMKLYDSLQLIAKPFLRQMLIAPESAHHPPITSIIIDWMISIALDVVQDIKVPIIYFRTTSACSFWAYFCIPQLIEAGELPFTGNDLDIPITNIKGTEGFLRRRDLPSFLRSGDVTSQGLQTILSETRQAPRAHGFILNTFEDLEGPILSQIRSQCPNLYTIGPLHAHLKTKLQAVKSVSKSNSLWQEDRSCIKWLDEQPSKSVIYVSFGSITMVKRDQLLEIWHGLVNSGTRFLWVIRPDSITGKEGESKTSPETGELERATKARGYMVGWAPQEEVLAHPAIGGFLTHSGWNSTLESIVEGVPMICWPYFADQQINSRFVGEVWRIGLDMKDTCDRVIIEKMVRDLMEVRRDQFLQRAEGMAKLAEDAIREGGSSFCNLDRLVENIRLISMPSKSS